MTTYTVGTGEEFATIAAAVAATQDGDTVLVNAGTYVNDFFTTYHKITLQSVGGLAILDATASPPNGKAIITSETDLTVNGLGFTGAAVADQNGAGIRAEGGNLTVQNSVFWNNQEGILATPGVPDTTTVTITGSEFSHNGAGDGYSHNIYIGAVAALNIDNSYFHDASVGHEIKSRAYATTITNTRIQDNQTGTASYSVDLGDGGVDVLNNDVIEKGPGASNDYSIHTGGDGVQYANSSLTVTNSTLIDDNPNGLLLLNQTGITSTFSGDKLYAYNTAQDYGPATFTNDTTLATDPALNTSTMVPSGNINPLPTTDASTGTTLQNWGLAGAVIATGHVLTVGANGEFRSLQSALAAAGDGDTIKVAAGTYVNDFATINHKVIIEGVGGIATFVQTNDPAQSPGYFTANTDATLENIAVTGASDSTGREGGLYVNAGNVTVENSSFSGNDVGIETADNASTNLAIYNTDIIGNGNAATEANNASIGVINSLTVQGSFIAGNSTGHELASRAFNDDIENDRIIDGATATASFLIDLGEGGNATIKNNLLVKGAAAATGVLIHVGGEATPFANSNVKVSGNTLVSQVQNPAHPYSYFVVGDASRALPPITATGNTFVGGVAGSQWLQNATDGGGNVAASSATISTASAVSAATIPPAFAAQTGTDSLSVTLAEVKGDVDAQFLVTIDGQGAGGGIVTAQTSQGATQTFTFAANLAEGPHQVGVRMLNPESAPGGGGAANLVLSNISLDGTSYANPNASLAAGAYTVSVTAPLSAYVDSTYYLANNPDVAAANVDPLQHYEIFGWHEGRNPDAFFDSKYYLTQNPDVAAAHVDPLLHYELYGWKEGRDPSLLFSDKAYLAANPDVAAAHVDPLLHYILFGQHEGRAAFQVGGSAPADPLVNAAYYDAQLGATLVPQASAAAGQAAALYAAAGWQQGLNPDAFFNTSYYLAHNPDVAAAHVDPLLHYELFGWKEGRDPSAQFSTTKYLNAYADVKAANVDPLLHYVLFGQAEGRTAFPS